MWVLLFCCLWLQRFNSLMQCQPRINIACDALSRLISQPQFCWVGARAYIIVGSIQSYGSEMCVRACVCTRVKSTDVLGFISLLTSDYWLQWFRCKVDFQFCLSQISCRSLVLDHGLIYFEAGSTQSTWTKKPGP